MNNNDERDYAEESANQRELGHRERTVAVRLGNMEFGWQRERTELAPARDAWTADLEVDALLAELDGQHRKLLDILDRMDAKRLVEFGQHLYAMGNTLAEVATAKARG